LVWPQPRQHALKVRRSHDWQIETKMWQLKDMPERPTGPFDARYRAFLETVSGVRAQLHRYCARMTGSRLDGEDLVQETLFEAYTKIETRYWISEL
jgi:hypothetical protein